MDFDFKEELKDCYPDWRYVPLDGAKRPNEPEFDPKVGREVPGFNWQNKPYTLDEVCTKSKEAIGLHLGPVTNTAAFDFDGPDSTKTFEHWFGFPISVLHKTLQNTSGRREHFQMFFKIPKKWQDKIKFKVLPPPPGENWGKVELRWGHGKQSVLLGNHPNNKRYNPATGVDEEVEPGAGDGRGYYDWEEGHFPEQVHLAPLSEWFCHKWAEIVAPKVVISDRAKAASSKSTDNFDEQALKIHNLTRAKKGLNEWFTDEKYYVETNWRNIGIALKQLGHDDWGDPDKFFDLWHEWSERDPRPKKYEGYEACAEKWEKMEIRNNGITFNSFIYWALEDGFLTVKDLSPQEKAGVDAIKAKAVVDPVKAIKEIVEELYELEKNNGDWNRNQYLRSCLGGRRIRKEEVDKRLFELFAEEHELPLSNHGGDREHRTLGSQLAPNEELRPQLKGFTLCGRDHVVYGEAGAGKTTFALALSYAIFSGCNNLFDREDGVSQLNQGATIWVGSDGEDGALGMAKAYIRKLKPPQEKEWTDHTTFVGANRETGEPPWGFSISNLHWLLNELERGHPSGVPYRLLAIDSLKKVLELAGIDFGIGPVGTVMRLMQAIAARFNVALVWIHHPKPGASVKAMGIDSAGGNSNIVQIPYGIIQLRKKIHKELGQYAQVEIQKLRGEQSRTFNCTLDEKEGLYKLVTPEECEDKTALILYEIWIRQDAGASTTEIAEGVLGEKKTVANNLTEIRKQQLIQNTKKRWYLTKAGCKRLAVEMPSCNEEINNFLEGEGKSVR